MFYYFGYGSNINPISLKAKGVEPVFAEPAILSGWELVFNVSDFFLIEGGTGNVAPQADAEVHGVVYQCHDSSLRRLDEIEAVGIVYRREKMQVVGYGGQTYSAFVYLGLEERIQQGLQPSARYINVLLEGGRKMEIDEKYISKLEKTEVRPRPGYNEFHFDHMQQVFTKETLAKNPHLTALAGAVFDFSKGRKEHLYLRKIFAGKDMTIFFLKRMENSDGEETLETVTEQGLTNLQRRYLNAYLHEFNREYKLVGRMNYKIDLAYRSPSVLFDPNKSDKSTASRIVLQSAEKINEILGHENLGFLSEKRGLVPSQNFPARLPAYYDAWEEVAENLHLHYTTLRLRNIIDTMPTLNTSKSRLDDRYLLRACTLLSMLAHAYHNVRIYPPPNGIPMSIQQPWDEVQQRLQRTKGVLSYIDLIVYNWKFNDTQGENFNINNLYLLFPTLNNQSERVFYLTQLEILANCAPIISSIVKAQEAIVRNELPVLKEALLEITACLEKITRKSLLNIDPNRFSDTYVNHVVWAKTVAPFAVPFRNNVLGPSGTSSPIFNVLDAFLERKKHNTFLGKEIKSLRETYPVFWQNFIQAISQVSLREYVQKANDPTLQTIVKQLFDSYVGSNGFLGRHRMKVYGFLEVAFKVGRDVTIGGFSGDVLDKEHENVDKELENARRERLDTLTQGCHFAYVKHVGHTCNQGNEGTKHVVINVDGLGIRYEPGDRCLVLPENSDSLIASTMQALGSDNPHERVALTGKWLSALRFRYGFANADSLTLATFLRFAKIRPLLPAVAEKLYKISNNNTLRQALADGITEQWEVHNALRILQKAGFKTRQLLDAPINSDIHLACLLQPEEFRNYTISSTMDVGEGDSAKELHLTVGVLNYQVGNETRYGTASSFLARSAGRKEPISLQVERPPRFALPTDHQTPIMMIAGGTGVGVFRSFVAERLKHAESGDMHLLFFTQSRSCFYYHDDFLHAVKQNKLKLHLQFSAEDFALDLEKDLRGGVHYRAGKRGRVNDFFAKAENAKLLWEFLQRPDAKLYVCGRTRFAKALQQSIREVIYQNVSGSQLTRQQTTRYMLGKMYAGGMIYQETFTNIAPALQKIKSIKLSEVARKNDPGGEGWLIIDKHVYDLTDFRHMHPGGHTVISSYLGMDASFGYRRAHDRPDIDVVRDIYRIGRVSLPDFRNQSIRQGKQEHALQDIFACWQKILQEIVEMQNCLLIDHSFQTCSVIGTQDTHLLIPYKVEKALESHKIYIESYISVIINKMMPLLFTSVCKLGVDEAQASQLAANKKQMQEAVGEEGAANLQEAIDNLVAREEDTKYRQQLLQISDVVSQLLRLDKECIDMLKDKIVSGVEEFETHSHRIAEHSQSLVQLLISMCQGMQNYYQHKASCLAQYGEHKKRRGYI